MKKRLPKMHPLLFGGLFLTPLFQGQAVTITLDVTVLDEPYLAQGLVKIGDSTFQENPGSMNFDVNGDGSDDLGFIHGIGSFAVDVFVNDNTQLLNLRVGGPSDQGGTAFRLDEGSLFGPNSESTTLVYAAVNPFLPFFDRENAWNEGVFGDIWPLLDEPLPRTVSMLGSLDPNSLIYDQWRDRSGFLGFRTLEEDGWHYGWVYIEDDPSTQITGGYVTAYAWETEPNKSVTTFVIPEPNTYLMLTLSFLVGIGRRKRSKS